MGQAGPSKGMRALAIVWRRWGVEQSSWPPLGRPVQTESVVSGSKSVCILQSSTVGQLMLENFLCEQLLSAYHVLVALAYVAYRKLTIIL